jgi:hypothetical protein
MTESFWTIPDTTNLRTPVTILKEQAEAVTQATNGVLNGEIRAYSRNSLERADFKSGTQLAITVPFLKDYSVILLNYDHNITMYPGVIKDNFGNNSFIINNELEFVNSLKDIFSSEKTKMILANLLSQANAAA